MSNQLGLCETMMMFYVNKASHIRSSVHARNAVLVDYPTESGLKLHVFLQLFFLCIELYFPASPEKRIEQLSPQSPKSTLSVTALVTLQIPASQQEIN